MRHVIRIGALATVVAGVLLALAPSLGAQERPPPISLEARGGYTFPVLALNDLGARSHFGYGLGVLVGLSPSFALYGGWGRDVFRCETCSGGDEIEASGVELGGKFIVPDRTRAQPWVKGGLLVSRSLLRTGTSSFESSRHLGFQAAVGLDAPVGRMVSMSPSVRFNSFTSRYDELAGPFAEFEPRTDFRYLSFDLSLQVHLR